MRRFAAIGLLGLSVLVVVAPAGAARRHKHASSAKCPPANGEVLLADAQAEVYVAPYGHGFDEKPFAFGCVYGHRRSYALGVYEPECLGSSRGGGCGSVHGLVLAGPIVAYEEGFGDEQGASYLVFVQDLRSGRVIHKVPTGTWNPPSSSEVGVGLTRGIVVKSDGAVAWIVESRADTRPPAEYEVHTLDKSGSRMLASGPDVAPNSLALAGSTLYWTQGGKPMSSTLN